MFKIYFLREANDAIVNHSRWSLTFFFSCTFQRYVTSKQWNKKNLNYPLPTLWLLWRLVLQVQSQRIENFNQLSLNCAIRYLPIYYGYIKRLMSRPSSLKIKYKLWLFHIQSSIKFIYKNKKNLVHNNNKLNCTLTYLPIKNI